MHYLAITTKGFPPQLCVLSLSPPVRVLKGSDNFRKYFCLYIIYPVVDLLVYGVLRLIQHPVFQFYLRIQNSLVKSFFKPSVESIFKPFLLLRIVPAWCASRRCGMGKLLYYFIEPLELVFEPFGFILELLDLILELGNTILANAASLVGSRGRRRFAVVSTFPV